MSLLLLGLNRYFVFVVIQSMSFECGSTGFDASLAFLNDIMSAVHAGWIRRVRAQWNPGPVVTSDIYDGGSLWRFHVTCSDVITQTLHLLQEIKYLD